ncbi:unnamed protein product [Rhodiola kirilowii]
MPSMHVQEPTVDPMDDDRTLPKVDDYDFDELLNLVAESAGNREVDEGAKGRDSPSAYDNDHDDTIRPEFVRGGTSAGGGLGEETSLGSMPHDDRSWITPAGDDK